MYTITYVYTADNELSYLDLRFAPNPRPKNSAHCSSSRERSMHASSCTVCAVLSASKRTPGFSRSHASPGMCSRRSCSSRAPLHLQWKSSCNPRLQSAIAQLRVERGSACVFPQRVLWDFLDQISSNSVTHATIDLGRI